MSIECDKLVALLNHYPLRHTTTYSITPGHAGDAVSISAQVTQSCDLGRVRGPQIDTRAKADGEDVLRAPVYQVKVEVVLQLRGVQHLPFIKVVEEIVLKMATGVKY